MSCSSHDLLNSKSGTFEDTKHTSLTELAVVVALGAPEPT